MKTLTSVKIKVDAKKTSVGTKLLPKIDLTQLLTDNNLIPMGGEAGMIYLHTDGQKCDTTSGCDC